MNWNLLSEWLLSGYLYQRIYSGFDVIAILLKRSELNRDERRHD